MENANNIDYFDDPVAPLEDPATLESLASLARRSRDLESEIGTATVALAEQQAELDRILRKRIPEIMNALGMANFKLTDGSTIEVKEDVKTSITQENKSAAFAWCEANNFDGIIKTKVTSSFGKDEIDKARAAVTLLDEAGYSTEMDRSIHPATLKSFVKECLADGVAIPLDVFGVFEFKVAKIKLPKSAK